jgi:hypothetical protein
MVIWALMVDLLACSELADDGWGFHQALGTL